MKTIDTSIKNLKVSVATKNVLSRNIHDILFLTNLKVMATGKHVSTLEAVSRMPDLTPKAIKELFVATLDLLAEAVKLLATNRHAIGEEGFDADALPFVLALVNRTSGDIGGRDQGRLFASIAYDFLEALRAEDRQRNFNQQADRAVE